MLGIGLNKKVVVNDCNYNLLTIRGCDPRIGVLLRAVANCAPGDYESICSPIGLAELDFSTCNLGGWFVFDWREATA